MLICGLVNVLYLVLCLHMLMKTAPRSNIYACRLQNLNANSENNEVKLVHGNLGTLTDVRNSLSL